VFVVWQVPILCAWVVWQFNGLCLLFGKFQFSARGLFGNLIVCVCCLASSNSLCVGCLAS
jgi:hypothetical protein